MPDEEISYLVNSDDETAKDGTRPNSYIPTLGAATSVIDQYRTAGIGSSNLSSLSIALTDVVSFAAIAKIGEGGISAHEELIAAELALQALLLHDRVHVVLPAPKVHHSNGLVGYTRPDKARRSTFGHDLFSLAGSKDWIVAPEYAHAHHGKIKRSTLANSPMVHKRTSELGNGFEYSNAQIADAVIATIQDHQIPAFLAEGTVVRRRGDGYSKLFYERLRVSWDEVTGKVPPVFTTISLPPLLAIVLGRLENRADLKRTISDLRDELKSAREELHTLNSLPLRSISQTEVERQTTRVVQSFDAIVRESRMSNAQRSLRTILSIQRITKPVYRFMAALLYGKGVPIDSIGSIGTALVESSAIVDRTVTARAFVDLLRDCEALQSLVQHHFTHAEIAAIERSLRR